MDVRMDALLLARAPRARRESHHFGAFPPQQLPGGGERSRGAHRASVQAPTRASGAHHGNEPKSTKILLLRRREDAARRGGPRSGRGAAALRGAGAARGRRRHDHHDEASDVWALGGVLECLCTHRQVYSAAGSEGDVGAVEEVLRRVTPRSRRGFRQTAAAYRQSRLSRRPSAAAAAEAATPALPVRKTLPEPDPNGNPLAA